MVALVALAAFSGKAEIALAIFCVSARLSILYKVLDNNNKEEGTLYVKDNTTHSCNCVFSLSSDNPKAGIPRSALAFCSSICDILAIPSFWIIRSSAFKCLSLISICNLKKLLVPIGVRFSNLKGKIRQTCFKIITYKRFTKVLTTSNIF